MRQWKFWPRKSNSRPQNSAVWCKKRQNRIDIARDREIRKSKKIWIAKFGSTAMIQCANSTQASWCRTFVHVNVRIQPYQADCADSTPTKLTVAEHMCMLMREFNPTVWLWMLQLRLLCTSIVANFIVFITVLLWLLQKQAGMPWCNLCGIHHCPVVVVADEKQVMLCHANFMVFITVLLWLLQTGMFWYVVKSS